jgi:hypothetical protein
MTAYTVEQWTKGAPFSLNETLGTFRKVSIKIDFSGTFTTTAGALGSVAGLVASDTVKLLTIPAGTYVLGVKNKVITAQGATCTMGVGDSAGATTYGSAQNLNTTTDAFNVPSTNTAGKYYAAADYILLTAGHTTNVAVVEFEVILCDLTLGK